MDNILLAAVMMMGFLFLFSASFFGSQYNLIYSQNTTALLFNNTNVSVVGGQGGNQVPQFPVCDLGNDIVSNIFGVGTCIANGVGWLFAMLSFRSDYQFLTIIFVAIGSVILYRIIRILKPTGGS